MGCIEAVDDECEANEKPGREVEVAAFSIARGEVTVAEFRRCVESGACTEPDTGGFCNWGEADREAHPINCVDWSQATAYCRWTGRRLPTEAEWEKAARGKDGRKYPWGNEGFGKAGPVANIADETLKRELPDWTVADGYVDGHHGTAPMGYYARGLSPYGVGDMIGNVEEWTADAHEDLTWNVRSVRGGSWKSGPWDARASVRYGIVSAARHETLGFRCVQ
jgi:iron(II)-dependent oxidoreductase